MASYIIKDMTKDNKQYGNEKGLSINHYLVKMVHNILKSVDQNTAAAKRAVILTMLDYSQAFERQSHILGVQSFIDNNVRISLIPTLISFFQNRKLAVKWKKFISSSKKVSGGGPQGGTAGILEHISLTKGNLDFLQDEEGYKFVDDTSLLEVLNLLSIGLSSFNAKLEVPSDIPPEMKYIPPENTKTQDYIEKICEWTDLHQMKLNPTKTKFMVINFCQNYQFRTRLSLKNSLLGQIHQTKLLGVIIQDNLSWEENTKSLAKRANS